MSDEFKIRVTLIVDSRIITKYRIEAYRENTTQSSLINEALAGWLKFLKNVDRDEREEAERVKTDEELLEIQKIQDEIVAERRLLQRRRSAGRPKKDKLRKNFREKEKESAQEKEKENAQDKSPLLLLLPPGY